MINKLKQVKDIKKLNKQNEDLHKEEMDRCVPIARKVLELMAEGVTEMGDITGTQPQGYKDIAVKVQQLFLEKNIYWVERQFIFQLLFQAFEMTRDITLNNLAKSFNFASQKMWGKEMDEIKFTDIDEILKRK